jgi:hypothetical protein
MATTYTVTVPPEQSSKWQHARQRKVLDLHNSAVNSEVVVIPKRQHAARDALMFIEFDSAHRTRECPARNQRQRGNES